MKSVGEIASEIWPDFYIDYDIDILSRSSSLGSLNALFFGCTLVPNMKSIVEKASKI